MGFWPLPDKSSPIFLRGTSTVCYVSQWGTMTLSCVLRMSIRQIQLIYCIYFTAYSRQTCRVISLIDNSCLLQLGSYFQHCVLTKWIAEIWESGNGAKNMSSQTSFKPPWLIFGRESKGKGGKKLLPKLFKSLNCAMMGNHRFRVWSPSVWPPNKVV